MSISDALSKLIPPQPPSPLFAMREAIQNALAFKAENPAEKASTGARIYHQSEGGIRKELH
jgi:hypothetical protein